MPKIKSTLFGVPIIKNKIFWGLYWGPLILGNDQTKLPIIMNSTSYYILISWEPSLSPLTATEILRLKVGMELPRMVVESLHSRNNVVEKHQHVCSRKPW